MASARSSFSRGLLIALAPSVLLWAAIFSVACPRAHAAASALTHGRMRGICVPE